MLENIDFIEKQNNQSYCDNNAVFLPSRLHENNVVDVFINDHHWKHLYLPYIHESLWKTIDLHTAINDTDDNLKGGNANNEYL